MQNGKRLQTAHLSQVCRALLDHAGDRVDGNLSEAPHYRVAIDRIVSDKQSDEMQSNSNYSELVRAVL